jgi:phosphatidylglycerol:prolipoprotein diacylglycerol transferase
MFFTALGYLTGGVVFFFAAREKKLATEGIGRIVAVAFLGGVIGAKLTEWIFMGWPFKMSPALILDPNRGGKSLLGGLLIGWLCAEIAKRRMGIKRPTGDLFALALPAGEAVARIGCYFNGCCFGAETTSSIAIYQHGAWRYPSQIVSSLVAASMFAVLFAVRKGLPREGDLFKLYLAMFGFTRFGLEFIRERESLIWSLSPMQWFCIELFVAGTIGLILSYRKRPKLVEAS